MWIHFKKGIVLSLLLALLAVKRHGQKEHNFKIELKMLQHKYHLKEETQDLRFVVTVTNLDKEDYDFGPYLRYSYKEYKDADYYLEATNLDGKVVSFSNKPDIDWLACPLELYKNNTNRIADTIHAHGIYTFKEGKYRVRWVYDPANAYFDPDNPHTVSTQKPIYSNWEIIEVIR